MWRKLPTKRQSQGDQVWHPLGGSPTSTVEGMFGAAMLLFFRGEGRSFGQGPAWTTKGHFRSTPQKVSV